MAIGEGSGSQDQEIRSEYSRCVCGPLRGGIYPVNSAAIRWRISRGHPIMLDVRHRVPGGRQSKYFKDILFGLDEAISVFSIFFQKSLQLFEGYEFKEGYKFKDSRQAPNTLRLPSTTFFACCFSNQAR